MAELFPIFNVQKKQDRASLTMTKRLNRLNNPFLKTGVKKVKNLEKINGLTGFSVLVVTMLSRWQCLTAVTVPAVVYLFCELYNEGD